jgi:formylglycine-generating enzyme required for sulfatase activity
MKKTTTARIAQQFGNLNRACHRQAKVPLLIIAIVAVIGFSMAACGGGDDDGNNPGGNNPGGGNPTNIPISMIQIQGGTFQMGSPTTEPGHSNLDKTQRQVTLTGFSMGKYLVTQAQYQAVMGTNPSQFKTPVSPETSTANRPVEMVTWFNAIEFCNKLSEKEGLTPVYTITGTTVTPNLSTNGYRLPTEEQWEYACRAGTTTAFNWGTNTINSTQANYRASVVNANNTTAGTDMNRTTVVGSYAPNAWGLYDMHGNVYEWCWDSVNSGARVRRGGSWNANGEDLRSGTSNASDANRSFNSIGFRLVRP